MSEVARTAVDDLFGRKALVLIAGTCVIESEALCVEVATTVAEIAQRHGIGAIFKASFDKANRTSLASFRGPGLEEGLKILRAVREKVGLPVLTDIHAPEQAAPTAEVVDVLQIPAFLCRQTDLLVAAARTGRPTNIKKGQFLAPGDIRFAVDKHQQSGGGPVSVTERGSSFGYHTLVVDMRGLAVMRAFAPVIFDATHSVQELGGPGGKSGGDRDAAPLLARAAAAAGIDGLFCEVHPRPDDALSDGPNALDYARLTRLVSEVVAIDRARRAVVTP